MIVTALIVMMVLTILLATVDLAWLIIKDIITPPIVLLDVNELLDIFGLFLLVLLGLSRNKLLSVISFPPVKNDVAKDVPEMMT